MSDFGRRPNTEFLPMHLSDQTMYLVDILRISVIMEVGRYVFGAGLMALVLRLFWEAGLKWRKIQKRSASAADVRREILTSLRTALIFGTNGLAIDIAADNGVLTLYPGIEPVGMIYLVVSVLAMIIAHDTYFYWTHRLMHHRRLFRWFHRTHHKSVTPTPFAAYAFDLPEAIVVALFTPLWILAVPMHVLGLFVFMTFMVVRNVMGHSGVELMPRGLADSPWFGWISANTHHDLHHESFRYNYGLYFTWWDRLMGTEHPAYRERLRAASSERKVVSLSVLEGTMENVREGAPAPERLHALDAVRGGALLLGIVFHATISFVPAPAQIWIVEDNHRSTALGVLFFTAHVFRLTTFFLIAGFFAHMSFHRRGLRAFIGDRLKRIAVPLVVGWPIVIGAIVAVGVWVGMPASEIFTLPGFPLTHLWFLYVLLEFYAGVLILRGGVALIDRSGSIRAGVDRLLHAVIRSPLAPVVLAAPVGAAFAVDPMWLMWFGVPTPSSFVTDSQALIGFGSAFGFGWLLHRQIGLIRMLERRWALNLILAICLIAASLAIVGITPQFTPINDDAIRLAGGACYAVATWTATFAVIGLALRFLPGFSPVWRYITDASYWLYLIHVPIVMALQVAVSRLDWPWPAKFGIILAVAFPVMFGSYELLVRRSFIGRVLNGRRASRATMRLPNPSSSSTLVADPQGMP
jgi:glucan biosynthesis protein C